MSEIDYREVFKDFPRLRLEILWIGPVEAQRMLSKAKTGRRLAPSRVQRYAGEMSAGRWKPAQPILRDQEDIVFDGGHRLSAVTVSGATVPFVVISGYPRELTFGVVDEVRVRNLYDWLTIRQEQHADILAPLIRAVYRDSRGRFPFGGGGSAPDTPLALIEFFQTDGQELRSIAEQTTHIRTKLLTNRWVSFLLWKFSSVSSMKDARSFLIELVSGNGKDGDPVAALRGRLHGSDRIDDREKLALCYKAWSAWMADEEVYSLRWARTGNNAEPFPTL